MDGSLSGDAPSPEGSAALHPRLRSAADRCRQAALYEMGALLSISPLFALASGLSGAESAGLLAALAAVGLVWNALYCLAFDRVEAALARRRADQRPSFWRVVQAIGLEASCLLVTTPVIATWTGAGWRTALAQDAGLAIAYSSYAFVFGRIYDCWFPMESDPARLL